MFQTSSKSLIAMFIPLVVIVGYLAVKVNSLENTGNQNSTLGTTVSSVDGKQVIEVKAKAGYSPASITAAANKDTILRVKTDSTFDCSSALIIPKLGIRKNLPPTATTDIALGSQAPGTKLLGTCSMGMYSFNMIFN